MGLVVLPRKVLEELPSSPLTASSDSWHFLWLHRSNLCLYLHMGCSGSVSPLPCLAFRFRVHLENSGWPHFETFNLITSAKAVFPNKVTFTVSRWIYLLRRHHPTYYSNREFSKVPAPSCIPTHRFFNFQDPKLSWFAGNNGKWARWGGLALP